MIEGAFRSEKIRTVLNNSKGSAVKCLLCGLQIPLK